MTRKNVAILFSSKPNFEEDAFKFFVLSLNKIQDQYEFVFPEEEEYYYKEQYYAGNELFRIFETEIRPMIHFDSKPHFFVNIINQEIEGNLFYEGRGDVVFITTDTWEKYYSPPSLFEYLTHCTVASLLLLDLDLNSHSDTKGCCLDYCYKKNNQRVDVVLGYICDKCKEKILSNGDKDSLDALRIIITREWIGNKNDFGSVAYDLKKFFNFDIDKQSGFNKNTWEKIKEPFYTLPKDTIGYFITALLGALVVLLFKSF